MAIFLLVLCLAPFGPARADRQSELAKLAAKYRALADDLAKKATIHKLPHVGTIFNEIGLKEAQCAALAYSFGKDEIFKRLIVTEIPVVKPRMTEQELEALAIDIVWQDNRAAAFETVVADSEKERVELWNLGCVRQHGIGQEHAIARAPGQALIEVRGEHLHVLGDIEQGFFERFQAVIERNRGVKYVQLGSGGGSVRDAMMAGFLVRRLGLITLLYSDCYSACPLVFLGGKERLVWSPYPRLGFHQVSVGGQAMERGHEVYDAIRRYADRMGANGSYLIELMHMAGPANMTYPDVGRLCDVGITTWVQRQC
jgi:hypothetical protein